MRVVAYIAPSVSAEGVQAHLVRLPGVTAVSCRSGRFWKNADRPEAGFDRVWAPDYPGIRAAYLTAGVLPIESALPERPWDPRELTEIEPADVITILCHGKHARRELAAHPPIGLLMAVNHSGDLIPGRTPDIVVANDGFVDEARRATCRIAAVRSSHRSTLPDVPWFALDRLGVSDGRVSVVCAILLAERMGVRRLRVIGNDCLPGVGSLPGNWGTGEASACRKASDAELRRLVAAGVAVEQIRSDGRTVWVETFQPTPSETKP
jgi:hypothetical protein